MCPELAFSSLPHLSVAWEQSGKEKNGKLQRHSIFLSGTWFVSNADVTASNKP